MKVACNAGSVYTDMIGDMKGYPDPVWYHPDGIANILSQHMVKEHYDIEYKHVEGHKDKVYDVRKADGSVRRFIRSRMGLSYMDVTKPAVHLIPAPRAIKQETSGVVTEESPGVAQAANPAVVEEGSPGVAQQGSPGVAHAGTEPGVEHEALALLPPV